MNFEYMRGTGLSTKHTDTSYFQQTPDKSDQRKRGVERSVLVDECPCLLSRGPEFAWQRPG